MKGEHLTIREKLALSILNQARDIFSLVDFSTDPQIKYLIELGKQVEQKEHRRIAALNREQNEKQID